MLVPICEGGHTYRHQGSVQWFQGKIFKILKNPNYKNVEPNKTNIYHIKISETQKKCL